MLEDIRCMLRDEMMIYNDKLVRNGCKKEIDEFGHCCSIMPIMHNGHVVILQLNGWSINLKSDGTWEWEDTTGG